MRLARRPRAIVTDIEGTTTPISFVRDTLFPYARAHMEGFIGRHAAEPEVRAALDEVAELARGQSVLAALLGWMDADAKVTPLKTIQGLIWAEGYRRGELKGRIYPDVPGQLREWRARGIRLYVYSSGSEAAQRLIFGHSEAGELASLFDGFFDTRLGGKRETQSYRTLVAGAGLVAGESLFLSDIAEELDAAAAAGLLTCQLVRPQDGTRPAGGHPQAGSFGEVDRLLPEPDA